MGPQGFHELRTHRQCVLLAVFGLQRLHQQDTDVQVDAIACQGRQFSQAKSNFHCGQIVQGASRAGHTAKLRPLGRGIQQPPQFVRPQRPPFVPQIHAFVWLGYLDNRMIDASAAEARNAGAKLKHRITVKMLHIVISKNLCRKN